MWKTISLEVKFGGAKSILYYKKYLGIIPCVSQALSHPLATVFGGTNRPGDCAFGPTPLNLLYLLFWLRFHHVTHRYYNRFQRTPPFGRSIRGGEKMTPM